MKTLLASAALFLAAATSAWASGAKLDPSLDGKADTRWTYVFYINGDFYHDGPWYSGASGMGTPGNIKIIDQAAALYKSVEKSAASDANNNYIIFYDPRGSAGLFSDSQVHVEVFGLGKQIYNSKNSYSEVDMTDNRNIPFLLDKGLRALGTELVENRKAFYFYGEHIGVHKNEGFDYDLSEKGSTFTQDVFFRGLTAFNNVGGIDLLIMHSCFQNTSQFLTPALAQAKNVVVDIDGIPNSPLKIDALKAGIGLSAAQLGDRLIQDNSTGPYPFALQRWDATLYAPYAKIMASIEKSFDPASLAKFLMPRLDTPRLDAFPGIQAEDKSFALPFTRELVTDLNDAIRILEPYTLASESDAFDASAEEAFRLTKDRPLSYIFSKPQ